MADFVIVVAAVALGFAAPAGPGAADAAAVPLDAPTVGFRTYADVGSCEDAAARLVAPPGRRLVCLPVERPLGALAEAY